MKRFLLPLLAALALPTAVNANESDWVLVYKDKYNFFGDKKIDVTELLLTNDGVTVYVERAETENEFGKLYIGTRWEGVDCQSKEILLPKKSEVFKTNRLPIRNPAKMTAYEKKSDPYDTKTFWRKYKLVCDSQFYKTETNQSSYEIFATNPPYGMTIYQYDLDAMGKSYKEAHQR